MEQVYEELLDLFYDFQPNDESFLEEYPELVDRMNAIEKMDVSTEENMKKAITALCDFLNEWFPDSVDLEEQKRVRNIIDEGYKYI